MGEVLIGTCSWTEETLVKGGKFYPVGVKDAESRLRYYSSQFPVVEVDSSYYTMPHENTSRLWAERTPDDFIFDVKSFRLCSCGARIPANFRICGKCGKKLGFVCGNCGGDVPEGYIFCTNCGQRMQ